MALTIRDAENSWLEAKKKWDSFLGEFQVQWEAPEVMNGLAQALTRIPPEVLERLPADTQKRLKAMRGG
jgi:hypothetical protein